jgi:hypothetical protein
MARGIRGQSYVVREERAHFVAGTLLDAPPGHEEQEQRVTARQQAPKVGDRCRKNSLIVNKYRMNLKKWRVESSRVCALLITAW